MRSMMSWFGDVVLRPASAPGEMQLRSLTYNNNEIPKSSTVDDLVLNHRTPTRCASELNTSVSDLSKKSNNNSSLTCNSSQQPIEDLGCLEKVDKTLERLGKDAVEVSNETVIASLVDGIVRSSGVRRLLYKCHLCHCFFVSLNGLGQHITTHVAALPSSVQPTVEPSPRSAVLSKSFSEQWTSSASLDSMEMASAKSSLFDETSAGKLQRDKCNGYSDTVHGHHSPPARNSDFYAASISDEHLSAYSALPSSSVTPLQDMPKPCHRRSRHFNPRRRATTDTVHSRRPSQRLAFVTSEMLADDHRQMEAALTGCVDTESHEAAGELANEIRAKEHLDDDVTVVIPSDAPLDPLIRQGLVTNDCHSWAGEPDDTSSKDDSDKQIAHAPVKSIMGHPHVQKKSRQSISTVGLATSENSRPVSNEDSPSLTSSAASSSLAAQQLSLLNVAAESLQFAGGLPAMFGPLALSTFVHGFGGLVAAASPFLSYYTQMPSTTSLASLMAVSGSPLVAPSAGSSADDGKAHDRPSADSLSDAVPQDIASVQVEEASSNGSSSSGWTSDALTSGFASPNIKCSSLSRTHSRLNVVRRPIKREDACRPVVLADGRTAFRCFYCKKDFCTISDVNRHMDFHEDIRPYKCRFCNYYARTNSQLKVHMMRHQGIREYMCRLCNYKGVTQSDLNRHTKSQIHLMKARNECIQCSEGFVSPMNLEQHKQDKHAAASHAGHTV